MWFVQHNQHDEVLPQPESAEDDQIRLDQHQQNACAYVRQTGLIYDAIQLAQYKGLNRWAWRCDQAENHPAILTLCAFWECFQSEDSHHEARIPYLQLFLGQADYIPIIPDAPVMSLTIDDADLQRVVSASSVIFDNTFLITFLAGRQVTARQSQHRTLVHYTVHHQPFLKEPIMFSESKAGAFDQQNQLAWKILQALHTFPTCFPKLWQVLRQQNEVRQYEIH